MAIDNEGVSVLILNDEIFKPYNYSSEKELETLAFEHAEELFGKSCQYFNTKKKITSRSGISGIPDGFLIDFCNDKFFIIEVELSSHDVVTHIMNQLHRFKMAMQNAGTKNQLAKFLTETITNNEGLEKKASDPHYLSKIIERGVGIFIIIDKVSEKLTEVMENLSHDETDVRAIPFESFVNSKNKLLHKFTTFTKETLEREAKKWTFNWTTVPIEKHLEKTNGSITETFEKLSKEICCWPQAKQVTRKGWASFQISPLKNFCTIKILKDALEVHLKADKEKFQDEKKLTKDLKRTAAWTFDKMFMITCPGEINYGLKLIKQSYEFLNGSTKKEKL